jgi:hypothetical protein
MPRRLCCLSVAGERFAVQAHQLDECVADAVMTEAARAGVRIEVIRLIQSKMTFLVLTYCEPCAHLAVTVMAFR